MYDHISNTPLKKWLISNSCFARSGNYTHLLLNGGKLHVSPYQMEAFYKLYANDISKGVKHYICEVRPDSFKMFCDFDFLCVEKEMDKQELIKILKEVQRVICESYDTGNVNCDMIVSTCENKIVSDKGVSYIKKGVHLIWPEIITDNQKAMGLRNLFIMNLEKKLGERPYYNKWEDVIDIAVYKNKSSLRMIGSRKISKCKKKNHENCGEECDNGKIDEGRVYMPFLYLNEKGEESSDTLEDILKDYKSMIKKTSIIPQGEVNDDGIYIDPETTKMKEIIICNDTIRKRKKAVNLPGKGEVKVIMKDNGTSKEKISEFDPLFNSVNNFCKKNMPAVYSKTNILELFRCENDSGTYYIATVDTNFCMNICREHHSNRIYFYINTEGVHQKCFCLCDTTEGRVSGKKCSEYRSSGRPLSSNLKYKLFPKERQKKSSNTLSGIKNDEMSLQSLSKFLDNLYDKIKDRKEEEDKMFGKSLSSRKKCK